MRMLWHALYTVNFPAMSWVRHAVQLLHGMDYGTAAAGAYSCSAAWEDTHLTVTAVQNLAVVTAVASQDILFNVYRCDCSTCYMFCFLLSVQKPRYARRFFRCVLCTRGSVLRVTARDQSRSQSKKAFTMGTCLRRRSRPDLRRSLAIGPVNMITHAMLARACT